jgi:hypothetical protein
MKKKVAIIVLVFFALGAACYAESLDTLINGTTATAATGLDPAKVIAGLSMWALIWGLIFNSIGVFAFLYGKKRSNVIYMVIGVLLVIYPYAIQQTTAVFVIGVVLTAALYFFRRGI